MPFLSTSWNDASKRGIIVYARTKIRTISSRNQRITNQFPYRVYDTDAQRPETLAVSPSTIHEVTSSHMAYARWSFQLNVLAHPSSQNCSIILSSKDDIIPRDPSRHRAIYSTVHDTDKEKKTPKKAKPKTIRHPTKYQVRDMRAPFQRKRLPSANNVERYASLALNIFNSTRTTHRTSIVAPQITDVSTKRVFVKKSMLPSLNFHSR